MLFIILAAVAEALSGNFPHGLIIGTHDAGGDNPPVWQKSIFFLKPF